MESVFLLLLVVIQQRIQGICFFIIAHSDRAEDSRNLFFIIARSDRAEDS